MGKACHAYGKVGRKAASARLAAAGPQMVDIETEDDEDDVIAELGGKTQETLEE